MTGTLLLTMTGAGAGVVGNVCWLCGITAGLFVGAAFGAAGGLGGDGGVVAFAFGGSCCDGAEAGSLGFNPRSAAVMGTTNPSIVADFPLLAKWIQEIEKGHYEPSGRTCEHAFWDDWSILRGVVGGPKSCSHGT
jgi:hypothetical protein